MDHSGSWKKKTELIFIPDKFLIHSTSVGENGIRHRNNGEVAVFAVPEKNWRGINRK